MKRLLITLFLPLILTSCAQGVRVTDTSPLPTVTANTSETPSPQSSPSAYPLPDENTKGSPLPEESYPAPQEQLFVNPYPEPQIAVMKPETRFGIEAVDRILEGLFTSPENLSTLIVYTQVPCTINSGLGGPPKCGPDQAEGTLIEGFPILGSEGQFAEKNNQVLSDIPGTVDLLGVFRVMPDFISEEYYPAGQYGIVLIQPGSGQIVVLRVDQNGIVRADYPIQIPGKEQNDLEVYLEPKP